MNEPQTPENPPKDHGQVVRRKRLRISWAWLFPILAAVATLWLFWSNWRSEGPEIEVLFDSAPGMQPGKTPLVYRGVTAGIVKSVHLEKNLEKVVLTVRLKAFAAELARSDTEFWIDQPVVSLGETSGLDALISGNTLEARTGNGGTSQSRFEGLDRVPLTPLESPALVLKLRAPNIPFLDRGSPIFFHGVSVGVVEDKAIDEKGLPYLRAVVKKEFADSIRTNSRFWPVSPTSIKIGANGLQLDLLGLKAILLGGVEFDTFGAPGETVGDEEEFALYADKSAARATGPEVRVSFRNGQGLQPGATEIRRLGIPVGLVESVTLNPTTQMIDTVIRFQPDFDNLHPADTTFLLIRPQLSLKGVSGLETIVTGVYIDCLPGPAGPSVSSFEGATTSDDNLLVEEAENNGLRFALHARNLPPLSEGAPLLYRGLTAGRVESKTLDANGQPVLNVVIRKEFTKAVAGNARFWLISPATAKIGPGTLDVDVASIESLVQGGIAFDVFGSPEAAPADGASFELFASEAAARATSPAIHVTFDNGQGLLAGQTQVRHLGQPVGIVESVRTTASGTVETVLRLNPGYDFLRREGSSYAVVRVNLSLQQGVSGLETLVSGIYIECVPAQGGKLVENFTGVSMNKAAFKAEIQNGLEIVVTARDTNIGIDAPVSYRGLAVGKIARKILAADGRSVGLVAVIEPRYTSLVRANTKFWDAGGLKISFAFISFKVQTTALDALTRTGIAFATPTDYGPRVKRGTEFELAKGPRPEWLKWTPEIPTDN